jgi:dihydrofolate reductase
MSLKIIVAVGAGNHVIGANNELPWQKIPRDMKHFRDTTMGHPIVMGRKTWDSLPEAHKPLRGRENIILTRNPSSVEISKGSVTIFENIEHVHRLAKTEDVFVIGGAEIYQLCMPHAEVLHLTFVHGEFKGDAYFPTISPDDWFESKARVSIRDIEDPYRLTFCTFSRKKKLV